MKGKGVLQDLIPNVGQLELAYVPIKGWITDPDVHGFLNGPGNTVRLPSYYGEIVHSGTMTWVVAMVMMGMDSWHIPWTFPKKSMLTHLCTPLHNPPVQMWTYRLLHFSWWPYHCLRGYQEVPEGVATFKMYLDPHLTTYIVEAFAESLGLREPSYGHCCFCCYYCCWYGICCGCFGPDWYHVYTWCWSESV